MDESIDISSFIVRIVHSTTADGSDSYRGSVRHIQTNREYHFSDWDEAIGFMQSFVPQGARRTGLLDNDGGEPGE